MKMDATWKGPGILECTLMTAKNCKKLEKLPILKRATQRVECIHAPPRRGGYWQSQKKMGTYEPSSGIFFPGKIQKNTQNSENFSKGLKL